MLLQHAADRNCVGVRMQNVRQMVDTNVTAVAILTKLFAAGMVERNRGHIINISSVAAHHAYPGKSLV